MPAQLGWVTFGRNGQCGLLVVTPGRRGHRHLAQHGLSPKIRDGEVDVSSVRIDRDRVRIRSDVALSEQLQPGVGLSEGGNRPTFGSNVEHSSWPIEGEYV